MPLHAFELRCCFPGRSVKNKEHPRNFRDREGTPKNLREKDFAELSGELSGAICLKTLVLWGSALELFRQFFGAIRAIFWLWGSLFRMLQRGGVPLGGGV